MELQMTIIFLFIVMVSSNTEEVKNLDGTEGGSITLPDPVVWLGFLLFGKENIAAVIEGKMHTFKDKNRILWNNKTGLFTITRLQRNDSGIYHIDSKTDGFSTSYKLSVYESVPTPAVNTLSVNPKSCTLLCFVEEAEETTLLWYKDEEMVNQSRSALSLPLTVLKQDFNSSYKCVAANPAEEKTLPVNVMTSCSGQNNRHTTTRHYRTGIVLPIAACAVIVIVAFIIKWKVEKNNRTARHTQDSMNREPSEDRQSQGGYFPDSSGTVDDPNLTTVYDKLEAHRIVLIDTADRV